MFGGVLMPLGAGAVAAKPAVSAGDAPMFALRALPSLTRRKRWAPGPNAQINWSHPLARGLKLLVIPDIGRHQDIAGRSVASITGAAITAGPSRFTATGVACPGTDFVTYGDYAASSQWSVFSIGKPTNTSGTAQALVARSNAGGDINYFLGFNGSSGTFIAGQREVGGTYRFTTGVAQTLGLTHTYAGTYDGTIVRAYRDGTQVGALASAAPGTASQTLGINWNQNTKTFVGSIYMAAVWNRPLTASEVAALYADPFRFLRS